MYGWRRGDLKAHGGNAPGSWWRVTRRRTGEALQARADTQACRDWEGEMRRKRRRTRASFLA